jgi:hypothetical protein
MKTLILILLTSYNVMGQFDGQTDDANGDISFQIRSGYNTYYEQGVISPAINFEAHGFSLSTEMIVNVGQVSPVLFGLKGSYELVIGENWSVQAGAGRYFELYSTDAYDKSRNGWSNLYFGSVHWDKWFVEYDYVKKGSILSIGVRETLVYTQ